MSRPHGFKHTSDTKARISRALEGNKNALGCKHSAESIALVVYKNSLTFKKKQKRATIRNFFAKLTGLFS